MIVLYLATGSLGQELSSAAGMSWLLVLILCFVDVSTASGISSVKQGLLSTGCRNDFLANLSFLLGSPGNLLSATTTRRMEAAQIHAHTS